MKKTAVSEITLRLNSSELSFKEKLELARVIVKTSTDVIEIPPITNEQTDTLFVRTLSSFVKGSILSCPAGLTQEAAETAWEALKDAAIKASHFCSCIPRYYGIQLRMKPKKYLSLYPSRLQFVLHSAAMWNSLPKMQPVPNLTF